MLFSFEGRWVIIDTRAEEPKGGLRPSLGLGAWVFGHYSCNYRKEFVNTLAPGVPYRSRVGSWVLSSGDCYRLPATLRFLGKPRAVRLEKTAPAHRGRRIEDRSESGGKATSRGRREPYS